MERSDMVCSKCANYDSGLCHLCPEPIEIGSPDSHWCSKGWWIGSFDRFMVRKLRYWRERDFSWLHPFPSLN